MKTFLPEYLRKLTADIFQICGTPPDDACMLADMLVKANLMGLDSHGVLRIPQYVSEIRQGVIRPGAPITLHRESATTAIVDGGWNFGHIAAMQAVEVAARKARQYAMSSIVLRRCRHVGNLGAYVIAASERHFVALATAGSAGEGQRVAPWGGREGRLATNPIAFAAPTSGNPIMLDFSTSMASEGKIRLMLNKGEALPSGWIVKNTGEPSSDPKDLYESPPGAILPFGGSEGYKGFALSLMAQILSGLLGPPSWNETGIESHANVMWLMVIDINAFMPFDAFVREMDDFVSYVRSSAPLSGSGGVIMPGDLNFLEMNRRNEAGIPVDDETWRQIVQVAQDLGIAAK